MKRLLSVIILVCFLAGCMESSLNSVETPKSFLFIADGITDQILEELSPYEDTVTVSVATIKSGTEAYLSGDSYKYRKTAPGKMIQVQEIKTLPDDYTGWSVTSALRFSRDRSMLFASNRGHNSISCFRVDSHNGTLLRTSVVSLPGSFPRDFNLTPDGRFLLVGLQHDDRLLAYEIDYQNGTLYPTGKECNVPSPCCIIFWRDYEKVNHDEPK